MAPATEESAKVVTIGADIETFGAVDAEANAGHGDFENFAFVDADATWGAFDCFAFASEFIEGDTIFLDGGNHGGNLFKFAGKLLEGGFDGGGIQVGDRFGFEDFALGILGIGGLS